MNIWKHFCTINHHKMLVMKGCFQVGLIKQGLLHDLSKYSPTEFIVGCRYYQGNMSRTMQSVRRLVILPHGCITRAGTNTI